MLVFFLFRVNMTKNIGDFEYWADKFEELPMYFMTFAGEENIDMVIEVRLCVVSFLYNSLSTHAHTFIYIYIYMITVAF